MEFWKPQSPFWTFRSQTNEVSIERFAGGRSIVLSTIQRPPTATIARTNIT